MELFCLIERLKRIQKEKISKDKLKKIENSFLTFFQILLFFYCFQGVISKCMQCYGDFFYLVLFSSSGTDGGCVKTLSINPIFLASSGVKNLSRSI